MTKTPYARPTKTAAASLGQKARTHWSTALRKKAFASLPPVEFMAEEAALTNATRSRRGYQKAAWTSVRVRLDQVAILDLLRKRHLRNTGKEISRAEVLAALMSAGLGSVLERAEFAYEKTHA